MIANTTIKLSTLLIAYREDASPVFYECYGILILFDRDDAPRLTTPAIHAAISDMWLLRRAVEWRLGQRSRILNRAAENVVPRRYPHLYQKCSGRIYITDTNVITNDKNTGIVIIILCVSVRLLL